MIEHELKPMTGEEIIRMLHGAGEHETLDSTVKIPV